MKDTYEMVIYTSAGKDYADKILDYIEGEDRPQQYFAHRLYESQCIAKEDSYVFKDLQVLCSNRDIKDIMIVDNSVRNYSLFVRNGIPITDFEGAKEDCELSYLGKYLRKLAEEEDVRTAIKHDFAEFLLGHYQST